MNTRRCLKVAARIHALLVQELGQGIEPARMLSEPLYARDVLLVCEGLPGTELPQLAFKFRQALAAVDPEDAARAGQTSGFSPSRFLNSLFGATTGSPASTLDTPPDKPPRSWFGRLRDSIK
ncbi:hypothetical protein [Rubrivivax rivuli]|uniref:Uncharacterized protein n=1 Tax=Rubrivivax rivuli TaxID=1862385 RepID=A0A437R9B6_9BURK|nr:hypothetical protein [Rubrivivax rivuli]RVU43297.1 hypothetical protein EOE66_20315 [Rubrivivax rivuli]